MISLLDSRRVVHGVDFSGARDAGKKIWIARGIIQQDVLLITECFKAKDLPDSGRDREQSLKVIRGTSYLIYPVIMYAVPRSWLSYDRAESPS